MYFILQIYQSTFVLTFQPKDVQALSILENP